MNGTSMKKLLALSVLILMVPSVVHAIEITIAPKYAVIISGVSAVGALVAHVVAKQYYDKDDEYNTTGYLPSEDDEQKIQISQWAEKIRNLLALISAAAGGFALREYQGSTITFKLR